MEEITFTISSKNRKLFELAKTGFDSTKHHDYTDGEIQEIFSKMLCIEDYDENEADKDFLEDIGWYDQDCLEDGSRFQNFVNGVKPVKEKKKKGK